MRKTQFWLFLLLGLASLGVALALWPKAFPTATIDFQVTSAEAKTRLAVFLDSMGVASKDYRVTAVFGEDTETTRFIELERGIPALEKLTHEGLNVWYWSVRWFKAQQHEEFGAEMDPQGRIVGYSHTIEEEKELPSLEQGAAQSVAEEFLRKHISQHPLDKLHFISASRYERPHRADYSFTWERDDFRVGDAPYRLAVTVQGNQVGGYSEYLKVPERWTRDFEKKRESNSLCMTIASASLSCIALGAMGYLIWGIAHRRLRWKRALPWGWFVLFAVIAVMEKANAIPQLLASYQTTQNWNTFVGHQLFSTLRDTIFTLLGVWILAAIADALYRDKLPGLVPFRRSLGSAAFGEETTSRSLFLGVIFALVNVAYVSSFYVLGRRWGIWTPVEIEYAKTLTGWFPWVSSIETGLSAAFMEELLFRVVALAVIWKVVRVRWIAVILSSATWAFLHSNYPQMPGYARGIELTFVGILWTVLMLRYGLLTTLTAHYLYDCWLGNMVVFQSASWMDRLGALLGSTWPIGLLVLSYWVCRKEIHEEVLQENEGPTLPPPLPVAPALVPNHNFFEPPTLTIKQKWMVFTSAVLTIIGCFALWLPQDVIYDNLGKMALSRAEIASHADQMIKDRGFDPAGFRRIITCYAPGTETTYLLENGTYAQYTNLFKTELNDVCWWIRYFRVLQKEELFLKLDKNGKLIEWRHVIPREAQGASLSQEAALELARKTLSTQYGVDLGKEKLVDLAPQKQEHRKDYWFEFERTDWKWADAKLRTSIEVKGDEVMGFMRYVKVPEEWELKKQKSGWKKFLASEFQSWLKIAQGLVIMGALFVVISKHMVPWRQAFLLATFPTVLGIAFFLDNLPWFFSSYETTTPLANFLLKAGVKTGLGTILGYFGQVFVIGVALGFARWAYGWDLRRARFWPAIPAERSAFWSSTLLSVLAAYAILYADQLTTHLLYGFLLPTQSAGFSIPLINSAVPWLHSVLGAGQSGFSKFISIVGFWSAVALANRRFPKLTLVGLIFYSIPGALQQDTWTGFFCGLFVGCLSTALSAFLAFRVFRLNPVAIMLTYVLWSLSANALSFWIQGGVGYRWQAVPILLLVLLPGIGGWLLHRFQRERAVVSSVDCCTSQSQI